MPSSRAAKTSRKPRDQYHHGDLRRALLQAAVRTIQKQGVAALTLRAVGEDLGVSRTALYRHFSNKAALLAAVALEGFRMFRHELWNAWQNAGKGHPGLMAMGAAYVRFALAHPSHYRVMFASGFTNESGDPDVEAEGTSAFLVLLDALVELQEQGLLQKDEPMTQAV
jgi:AcrR family transcriptional regulator